MKRLLTITLITAALVSLALALSTAESDGQEEARRDIKAGAVKYLLYGQPAAHDQWFAKVLKDDYNITLVIVGGCTVAQKDRQRADGYNQVIREHLKQKSTPDLIKFAEDKARQLWEKHDAKAAKS